MYVTDGRLLSGVDHDRLCATVDNRCSLCQYKLEIRTEIEGEHTENSMFVMSCFTAFGSCTTSAVLLTLALSPVRMAWSILKLLEETERILQSAGILSPTATAMISPGTSSEAWTRVTKPDRNTLASSGEYSFRA